MSYVSLYRVLAKRPSTSLPIQTPPTSLARTHSERGPFAPGEELRGPTAQTALRRRLSEQMARVEAVLNDWDESGTGEVSKVDFWRALSVLGWRVRQEDSDAVFTTLASDADPGFGVDCENARLVDLRRRLYEGRRGSTPTYRPPRTAEPSIRKAARAISVHRGFGDHAGAYQRYCIQDEKMAYAADQARNRSGRPVGYATRRPSRCGPAWLEPPAAITTVPGAFPKGSRSSKGLPFKVKPTLEPLWTTRSGRWWRGRW